jgi:murein DD-endopeptidase MepM/ murein hydrolase activator NlpD
MPFPLLFVPVHSWKTDGRKFGAARDHGRKHAGCDLLAPVGAPVLAVADGVVIDPGLREFYHGTRAVVVRHADGLIARYCEVKGAAPGLTTGSVVVAGQVIAFVGKMYTMSMLHFELYAGTALGPLTVRKSRPFERRADLVDPTAFLDRMAHQASSSKGPHVKIERNHAASS